MKRSVRVSTPVAVGVIALAVWALVTGRVSLWSAQFGAWSNSKFGRKE